MAFLDLPGGGDLSAEGLVARLAAARIGETFNQYSRSRLRRERLGAYLAAHWDAPILLVGEAAGYRGARISGIPFTSERQLSGKGPAEASATVVHRALEELGLEDRVLLWNVVPTHPGTERSNRPPTRAEIAGGFVFLRWVACGRLPIAVGRVAQAALGGSYVRHPARGGAVRFREDLVAAVDRLAILHGTVAEPSPAVVSTRSNCPAGPAS
jgi:uracil-DNA glycosylase